MASDSESFLVTVPKDWSVAAFAKEKRKFSSVQDFVRELIRRDIESYDKEEKKENNNNTA